MPSGSGWRSAGAALPSPPLSIPLPPSVGAMELLARAVAAHLDGKVAPLCFLRDDGYVDEQSAALFVDETLGPHEAVLLDACHGAVLDAGCGAGRLALPLQRRGVRVVGVDLAPTLVDVCRRRGLRAVREGSVWDDPGGPWDAVLLGGNNVGLGVTPTGAGRLLAHLAAALRPGGAVLVSSVDVTRTTDPVHLAYHERNRAAGRAPGMIRLSLRFGDEQSAWFDWLHLAPAELDAVAAAAGLRVEVLCDLPSGAFAAAVRPA